MTETNTNTETTPRKTRKTRTSTKAATAKTSKVTQTKTTALDDERLQSWGLTLKALAALQQAYLAVSKETTVLTVAGQPAGAARAMRDSLADILKQTEVELWRNARSSGLSSPKFLSI